MQFSTVLGLSAAASVASAAYVNTTSTADVLHNSTTVITVTSCADNKCSTVPVTTGLTVVTTTINNVVTHYTTYCPLTTTQAPKSSVVSTAAPSSKHNVSTTASVSTYHGAAVKAVPAVAAVAAGVALLF